VCVVVFNMSEKGANLELSDEQREGVRALLSKFSGKKDKKRKRPQEQEAGKPTDHDPDPLEESPPGTTLEWDELTAKTRRYAFVRETYVMFVPYILDKIPLQLKDLNEHLTDMGLSASSQTTALTVCSVNQADPVRVFHIQTEPTSNEMLHITALQYIV
jgi:hypothetical protein